MKKIVIPVIILLLLSITTVGYSKQLTSSVTSTLDGNVLYVGGDGPGNYSRIQDAIDNASDGDTVFVYNGIYNENILIQGKNINLIGEDKNNTIIDGGIFNGCTILIMADWVNISGFTIQNGMYGAWGSGVTVLSSNNTISGNNIINNGDGIAIYGDYNSDIISNNIIKGNNIISNHRSGIYVISTNNNIISGNAITNGNGYIPSNGIQLQNSSNNIISDNDISSNNGSGIDSRYSCYNNIISNNFINSNNYHGIWMIDDQYGNRILENNISLNGWGGIHLYRCSNHIVSGNTISNNNWKGLRLQFSCNNSILNNSVFSNVEDGIYLQEASNNNSIIGNHISSNDRGLCIKAPIVPFPPLNNYDNQIFYNNFINNSQNAYDDCENSNNNWYSIFEEGNYWDDYTGIDDDGDGIGDTPYEIEGGNQDRYPLMEPYGTPIPKLDIESITGGKTITAVIKNTGDGYATNVEYNITIDGGLIIIPKADSGDLGPLAPGESKNITLSPMGIGLGIITPMPKITVTATCAEGSSAEKSAEARIILFFVLIK